MENNLPKRKSPRAKFHDYCGGDYFVTICTHEKKHYFGEISDGVIHLTQIGLFVDKEFACLQRHYPYVEVPLWVVMPNHVHAIIRICVHRATGICPSQRHLHAARSVLSTVIGGLKRAVTLYAKNNDIVFGWQGRYHDHIIRGVDDGNRIAEYIRNNVARWDTDCFYLQR